MEFLKDASNILYCEVVVLIAINSSFQVYNYLKSGKTEDGKKELEKSLGRGLIELVFLSLVHFL